MLRVRSRLAAMAPLHTLSPRALLLLPPPPAPPTYAALKAAYGAPLFTVLRQLARAPHQAQEPAVLDIALPCPHLHGRLDAPRGPLYAATQQLVANLYKLITVVAAKDAIDTDGAQGVDARVILVAYPGHGQLTSPVADSTPEHETQGPAIDLHTLAHSSRAWDTIFSVESEQGERVLGSFLSLSHTERSVSKVRGGTGTVAEATTTTTTQDTAAITQSGTAANHYAVAVGGTFDHLHIGHKLLLTMFAFMLGRRQGSSTLTVGITGDALLQNKKYAEHLESWKSRQESVHSFLSSIMYFGRPDDEGIQVEEIKDAGPNGHVVQISYPSGLVIKYVEIWDPFGPTITDKDITALVLSLETRSGGAAVNDKRKEQGWNPLEVFEVAVLDASEDANVDESFQSKLSSTEIRKKRSERIQARARA